jgi:phosphoribosylformylglycinamidine synthase
MRAHTAGGHVKATVNVELKSGVLDPQGKAIQHSLAALGFGGVEDVRVGKVFRITLKDDSDRNAVEAGLRQMCERLLANTVVENFSYRIED